MGYIDYRQGMDFGTGLDGLTCEVKGDAVLRTAIEEEAGAQGQTVSYSIDKIETYDQVEEVMGLSADVDASYGLFNMSAKASFCHSSTISAYGVFLLVSILVQNSFRQMRDVQFKPEVSDLLRKGKINEFRRFAGDKYVRGKQTGGEFYALLTISTRSQKEQDDVSAKLGASYGFGLTKISADAEFQKSLTELKMQSQLSVRSFQRGGTDISPVNSIDGILARAKAFPASVAGNCAVDFSVMYLDYYTILMPDMPSFVDIEQAKQALNQLAQVRSLLFTSLSTIDYVLQNPSQFKPFDAAEINTQRAVATGALNAVMQAASRISHDITNPALPQIQLPDLQKLPPRVDGTPIQVEGRETSNGRDDWMTLRRQIYLMSAAKQSPKPFGSAASRIAARTVIQR